VRKWPPRIALGLVAALVLTSAIYATWKPPEDGRTLNGFYLAAVLGFFLMTGSSLWWARAESGSWRATAETLGMRRGWSWTAVAVGVAAGLLVGFLLRDGEHPLTDAIVLSAAIPVFLASAFNEELFFRGAGQRILGYYQAALFGFLHLPESGILGVAIGTTAGLGLGWLRTKQGLWPCVAAHAAFNLSQFAVLRFL
jgi:membrane protease YdiL (CAAX protease family)